MQSFFTYILQILHKTACIASSPIGIAYVHISELAAACGRHAEGLREQALCYSTRTFRCRQTKPEINILFAVCRILN